MATQTKEKEKVVLEADVRAIAGKQAESLRRTGLIPAVVYGEGGSPANIQVDAKELSRVLHTKAGGNVLISLRVNGGSKKGEDMVLIRELQHHPVTHKIIHIDFHRVSLTKRITVTVPLTFKGDAIGVKQGGGILEHIRWDIEVECLPTEIPAEIPVDVTALEVGKTIAVKDLQLQSGVRVVTDPELPIVTCEIPKEEAPPVAEEAAAAATEPEVLKQKKPEEEAAEEGQKGEKAEKKEKEK